MALDTAAKRFSMMDATIPSMPALGPPSSIDASQRLHLMWLYSGYAGATPVVAITPRDRIIYFEGLSRTIIFPPEDRGSARQPGSRRITFFPTKRRIIYPPDDDRSVDG